MKVEIKKPKKFIPVKVGIIFEELSEVSHLRDILHDDSDMRTNGLYIVLGDIITQNEK